MIEPPGKLGSLCLNQTNQNGHACHCPSMSQLLTCQASAACPRPSCQECIIKTKMRSRLRLREGAGHPSVSIWAVCEVQSYHKPLLTCWQVGGMKSAFKNFCKLHRTCLHASNARTCGVNAKLSCKLMATDFPTPTSTNRSVHQSFGQLPFWCSAGNENWNDPHKPSPCGFQGIPGFIQVDSHIPYLSHQQVVLDSPALAQCEALVLHGQQQCGLPL